MAMNPRLLRPLALPRLLDFAPGAAAAFSLRQLSSSYAGPVVTVRRSSDDAEADFTAGEVNDGTLAAWVGSGNDGFVKTWHDQAGSNDATNGTATEQPKIVNAGVLVTEGGKPAVKFDGSDDSLDANGLAAQFSGTGKLLSVAAVGASGVSSGASNYFLLSFGNSADIFPYRFLGHNFSSLSGAVIFGERGAVQPTEGSVSGGTFASQSLAFVFSSGVFRSIHVNGVSGTTNATNNGLVTLNLFSIGCLSRTSKVSFWPGTISEIVIYPSDQTASRQRIEGDIAWYY